jgi:hypothetical protein
MALRSDGLGVVRLNMPWDEAVGKGIDVVVDAPRCHIGLYLGATVYAAGDAVSAIIVQAPGIRTIRGVGVGSARFVVATLYPHAEADGDRLRVTEGANELVFGFHENVVAYVWAKVAGIVDSGC